MHHISRNGWIGLVVAAVLVGGGIALFLGGYVPQIGRFFAAEPGGYIPFCAGYGQRVTLYADGGVYPSCCSGLLPTVADAGRFETPGVPPAEVSDDATVQGRPTRDRAAYCVMPECKVYRKSVQCIQAPCEPVVEIVCPPGVTPPPTPTYYPTPTDYRTPTPTPMREGISLGFGSMDPQELPLSEPEYGFGIIMERSPLVPGNWSASVTGVSVTVDYNPEYLEPVSVTSDDFPEVLEPLTVQNLGGHHQLRFTLGSGTTPAIIGDGGTVGPVILFFRPLKAGDAGLISITDATITVSGVSENVHRRDERYNHSSVALRILGTSSGQPGDADGDGDVDIFDYNIVVSEFGRTNDFGYDRGDLDKNGKVDIFDYNLVVSNFGRGVQ